MTKNILGLDLGTTSIGFAHVIEGDTPEQSSIKNIGVRVNPLTTDEQTNFEKGKPISVNADRTLKRGARRNLDRFQDRRKNLIDALIKAKIITPDTILAEDGKNTTHSTYFFRAKSAVEKIEKEELARVFLAINKKRGYKSSRKAKNEDEGQIIDGMSVAKKLYDENITPGQLAFQLLQQGKKYLPDFYRSDLQSEFDKVWNFQKEFYPEIFTDEFYKELKGKGQRATSAMFWTKYGFNTAENKAKSREEKKLQAYQWRSEAIYKKLEKEEVAFVITEINNNLHNSSGYLGAISDRSKELFFNNQTVGQFLYNQIKENPHTRLKNQVFYRQDYLDEFEKIWETQAKFYSELTSELKTEIRDIIIFYQRKLKSQKSLVSFCEFESKEIEIEKNGQVVKRTIGLKVAPKSSPLFQEFKIWQVLNNVLVRKKGSKKRSVKKEIEPTLFDDEKEIFVFDLETKQNLFEELNIKGNLKSGKIIELLGCKPSEWELNYSELEGNRTNKILYDAFLKILELEGYDEDLLKLQGKDDIDVSELKASASEIKNMVKRIFEVLGFNTEILEFDAELEGKDFEKQASYQLWHLLYSYQEDDSKTGNDTLFRLLEEKFGFKKEHGQILANVVFSDDYGNLSSKAMRKIYPFIKENNLTISKALAGYKEKSFEKKHTLELLKKNSLRSPVVEKILNQLTHVVNTIIENNSEKDENGKILKYFKFDEIRIELSRDLKKNAKERADLTKIVNSSKSENDKIRDIIKKDFPGVPNPTKNDIIKYKLYQEMASNGYKDLYTNTKIDYYNLFGKDYDIDHIIPQAKLFDDSFSNKVLVPYKANRDKGKKNNATAYDYMSNFPELLENYLNIVEVLYKSEKISKAKYQKLLKQESDIGDGFIERDLKETQYIAKKAKNLLIPLTNKGEVHCVVSTSGRITDRLREDWDLINVMKEINLPKYRALGLTEIQERKFGQKVEIIKDWTKRNDHRHHAMDALTVAFTKRSFIQYLNNLNARRGDEYEGISNSDDRKSIETNGYKLSTKDVLGIEKNELKRDAENKLRFKEPMLNFRQAAKEHLENILVSHKAKNKVVTRNKNKTKSKNGERTKVELTPRGQLHKETVYGKYQYYVNKEEKVTAKFDEETIKKVANPTFKKLLLQRLAENGNDPKKAFSEKNVLSKNPIYLNGEKTETLPETVKLTWLEEDYSIRKDVTPENFKDLKTIEKILDEGVKRILKIRLEEFGNDPKKAFSDLDKNPIWLNKEKGISIKRVTISGIKNAEFLHYKKDHLGKDVLDKEDKKIPVDFVSTGNNHHVAIYRDEKGNLQEKVVSLFDAVQLVNAGEPVIDKNYNQGLGWQFLFTMKQNEYFVFPNADLGFDPKEIDLLDPKNKKLISPNLFRVQTISVVNYGNSTIRDFKFRHHLETTVDDNKILQGVTYQQLKSLPPLENIIKVRLNHLGNIVKVGEY